MKLYATILLVPAAFLWQLMGSPHVVAPPATESVDVIFSHRFHIEDQELACDDCHSGVEDADSGVVDLLPTKETCSDCHEVDDPDECSTCHSDATAAQPFPRVTDYSEKFSHSKHIGAELACATCHEAVAAKETAQPYVLPTMPACVDCHDLNAVSLECQTCHLPGENLLPASHVGGFARTHGRLAADNAASDLGDLTCQTCHDDVFCQDCHEGDNLARESHPLNYEFTHALDAQLGSANCVTCHTETQFCSDCHRDNQLLPQTHRPGWANRIDGGRHRFEASADLGTCISCHDDNADIVCQPCHGS